jgi:hypothetical protein
MLGASVVVVVQLMAVGQSSGETLVPLTGCSIVGLNVNGPITGTDEGTPSCLDIGMILGASAVVVVQLTSVGQSSGGTLVSLTGCSNVGLDVNGPVTGTEDGRSSLCCIGIMLGVVVQLRSVGQSSGTTVKIRFCDTAFL